MTLILIDRQDVATHLTYPVCIRLMAEAMTALSAGGTRQIPREILPLDTHGNAFGVMLGAMGGSGPFGSKLVSVYPGNFEKSLQSHQGVVTIFDPVSGAPVCVAHAGEITAIRTAAASAVATDVLARPGPTCLAILGYGEQAGTHLRALGEVRELSQVFVWGRSRDRADAFAAAARAETGLDVRPAASVAEAVAQADVICTTTAAQEPLLLNAQVKDGAHINVVGSSRDGPSEIEEALVARSRFFVDHREAVLRQGAEFRRAKAMGLVDDAFIAGEIGEVISGARPGRTSDQEVTIYKSLGNIVQDLASGWHLYQQALAQGFGTRVAF